MHILRANFCLDFGNALTNVFRRVAFRGADPRDDVGQCLFKHDDAKLLFCCCLVVVVVVAGGCAERRPATVKLLIYLIVDIDRDTVLSVVQYRNGSVVRTDMIGK